MEEEAELEWERELEENIKKLCETCDTTAIIVEGISVRTQKGLVIVDCEFDLSDGSTCTLIYDSINDSFRKGPRMKVESWGYASVTLPSGNIAMFGGYNKNSKVLSSCEVFNVESNSFSDIGDMIEKRWGPAAVLLPTGVVLIIGGHDASEPLISCEFFNPTYNEFSPSTAKLAVGRANHTASLLPDGRVLVCGGGDEVTSFETTEIYDPSTDSFSGGPLMTERRSGHAATTLENGKVLLTGGINGNVSSSTELYDPTTNFFSKGPDMHVARYFHLSIPLRDGGVLIGGGLMYHRGYHTTEIYDYVTNSVARCSKTFKPREKRPPSILSDGSLWV